MSYALTAAIEQAIDKCKGSGEGKVAMNDPSKTVIYAEWTEYKEELDVIEVSIYQYGVMRFEYIIEETITESKDDCFNV